MSSVEELEREAQKLHLQAQQLNKQGKFEDANAAYRRMYELEDESLRRAADVATKLESPPPPSPGYQQLHAPLPWPKEPSGVRDRALAAIKGSITGDAAAMGVHWVYDPKVLKALMARRNKEKGLPEDQESDGVGLEFMEPSQNPFFSYEGGRSSPYGEQAILLLRSLVVEGGLQPTAYAQETCRTFGEGWTGYRDASTKGFLRNYYRGYTIPPWTGADDHQANCFTRLAPLVAVYASDPRLMDMVEYMTRVTQNDDIAVAWGRAAARILESIILGNAPSEAVATVIEWLKEDDTSPYTEVNEEVSFFLEQAMRLADKPHAVAVSQLGCNCHLPNSLQTPIHMILHIEKHHKTCSSHGSSDSSTEAFKKAIREAIRQGGCSASRSTYIGACLGAYFGLAGVPQDWFACMNENVSVRSLMERLGDIRDKASDA